MTYIKRNLNIKTLIKNIYLMLINLQLDTAKDIFSEILTNIVVKIFF